jgi:hypothetical protein
MQRSAESSDMEITPFETLATLRAAIGYLGEREQFSWWQSSFFSAGSQAFLAPVFGRTQVVAQCTGVTRAAGLVHDERIGVGQVFHLFRLPEDVEQGIHRALQNPAVARRITAVVEQKDVALDYLRAEGGSLPSRDVGPVRVGQQHDLHDSQRWRAVAAQYGHAFEAGVEVYPYFTDRA